MLELLGDDFISQHIYNERYKEIIGISYMSYVTDNLKSITECKNRWFSQIKNIEKPKKPAPKLHKMIEMVRKIK